MGVDTTNSVAGIVRGPLIVPLRIAMYSSEPLHHFVDDYLQYLQEVHPTIAALDGVHAHDDLLEDLGRSAIEADTHALSGFSRRLNDIRQDGLTAVERIEHPIVAAHIKARMFEAEEVRTWERNPQLYGDVLASSLAAQALFAYAPPTERARRVLSKLRQTGRLIQAARDNVKDPPGIFVKVGIETLKGTLTFIERDLPRAFGALDIPKVLLVGLLLSVITTVGYLACVLPGLVFSIFSFFTVYFVVDKAKEPVEAIGSSCTLVGRNFGNSLLSGLLAGLVLIAGALLCLVGLLAAVPVVTLAGAYAYRRFQGQPVAP